MNNLPKYIIERWEHGWVLSSPDYAERRGIPMDALSEAMKLFPANSVMDLGIVHHLRATGRDNTVVCVVTKTGGEQWRKEITGSILMLPAQERWWKGFDVGTSSAAIFAVFCGPRFEREAAECGRGAVPLDADDFGRCERLMKLFPEWSSRLAEVAAKYPDTKWPAIIARWDELVAAEWNRKREILQTI